MSSIKFEVEGISINKARTSTKVRHFNVDVDEPESLGGTDQAPNPVEYILIGLAGCINVVAHTVASELGIEINNLKISASGEINVNKFLGISDDERAGYKSIELKLSFETDANTFELEKWQREVNRRCPVKDNLFAATPVNIEIATNVISKIRYENTQVT